jgi:hypothetical protein
MNINSNAFLDRVEITFYSVLTSFLSHVNRIEPHISHLVNIPGHLAANEAESTSLFTVDIPEKTLVSIWTYISQALIPLIIWMILGFAAGFLIGMIKPR